MATYEHRKVTSVRHEWIVPATEPWGAAHAEIGKAWSAADRAYRETHGLDKDTPLSDDAIWFHVTDDAVVIRFTTETPQAGGQ
ncbi:hypothetical protein OG552_10200 [Streptomyces sp. NBC_01476]|uniref:hypothetical protein n=1 Tax=Streptomyces sp. NBC_01476 TaxID=2903881 RepID=UPI002E3484CA|nr:hypothetical protein [Streptomyces sp. NBC_01476]